MYKIFPSNGSLSTTQSIYELTIGTNPLQRTGGNGSHLTVTSMLKISGTSQPNASFVSEGLYYCYTYVDIFDTSVVL